MSDLASSTGGAVRSSDAASKGRPVIDLSGMVRIMISTTSLTVLGVCISNPVTSLAWRNPLTCHLNAIVRSLFSLHALGNQISSCQIFLVARFCSQCFFDQGQRIDVLFCPHFDEGLNDFAQRNPKPTP